MTLLEASKFIDSFCQDIIQKWPARKDYDIVTLRKKQQVWTFNGVTSIKSKVDAAIDQGAGICCGHLNLAIRLQHVDANCSWRHDLGGWSRLQVCIR